ncbi:MAG: DUF1501 domain-containing protein [Planctomycetaceae bacterium]
MNRPTIAGCSEFRHGLRLSRLGLLQLGALGLCGPDLSGVLAAPGPRANNVILLWMRGGPSHIDMWDPKPDAPAEYRGEFGTIPTTVPGIQLTDMLPLSAQCMTDWSIVRSLHHQDAGHSTGDQICFTGYPSGPNGDENIHPSCCSIVAEQLGSLDRGLPVSVMIPRQVPGTGAAYLGVAHRPFETLADPANTGPFVVPNFRPAEGISVDRLGDRRGLLAGFDRLRREVDHRGQLGSVDRFQEQAWGILTSERARQAFDLDSEPREVRERYGFEPAFDPGASNRCGAPAWSQRILLARRLIEAGVRLVTVDLRWWDTHVQGFDSLRRGFLPRWDRAFSALVTDLRERGLLETTLVVAWGEFGRTPRVNNDAGRDHYPNVFSAALAGGPVRGGRVLGASDAKGAFPKSTPKTPQDVLATMYRHLGVDPHRQYLNNAGRPIPVLPSGQPLLELS